MADQKIILTSTNPGGQTLQKTLTDINPDATNAQLKTFGQKLNALTNNTYGKTDRIIKYNCDTEEGGGSQTPTLTVPTSVSKADFEAAALGQAGTCYSFNITYDGDATPFAFTSDKYACAGAAEFSSGNAWTIRLALPKNLHGDIAYPTYPFTVTVRADATDNFKAAEATFTVTA